MSKKGKQATDKQPDTLIQHHTYTHTDYNIINHHPNNMWSAGVLGIPFSFSSLRVKDIVYSCKVLIK